MSKNIQIDGSKITDLDSFHDLFSVTLTPPISPAVPLAPVHESRAPADINSGNMLPVLYCSGEFRHVPIRERRKAAWEAQQRAMRHWQFWFALALAVIATVLGSLIAQHFLKGDRDGTVGAALGFILGAMWYARTLFRIGMPYYRQILSAREKADAENSRQ